MNVVLFGIQGSGKGTQAKLMAERYNLVVFEAGSECRKLASEDSELGRKVKAIVDNGKLVPGHIIIQILDQFLSKIPHSQNIIFDGLPRNSEQQKEFDEVMKKWQRDFMAINIQLPPEETINRLLARGRHDDVPEVITTRIKIFVRETSPVIEHYRSQGRVIDVNGNQSIEAVAKEITLKFDPIFHK